MKTYGIEFPKSKNLVLKNNIPTEKVRNNVMWDKEKNLVSSPPTLSDGLVHKLPKDMRKALSKSEKISTLWESLTTLGRNEFICWVEDAKQEKTRERRIQRTIEELLEGEKRPCCWVGCIHRTDKKPSKWQQAVLIDKKPKPSK
jgi:hypothetical protein